MHKMRTAPVKKLHCTAPIAARHRADRRKAAAATPQGTALIAAALREFVCNCQVAELKIADTFEDRLPGGKRSSLRP